MRAAVTVEDSEEEAFNRAELPAEVAVFNGAVSSVLQRADSAFDLIPLREFISDQAEDETGL